MPKQADGAHSGALVAEAAAAAAAAAPVAGPHHSAALSPPSPSRAASTSVTSCSAGSAVLAATKSPSADGVLLQVQVSTPAALLLAAGNKTLQEFLRLALRIDSSTSSTPDSCFSFNCLEAPSADATSPLPGATAPAAAAVAKKDAETAADDTAAKREQPSAVSHAQ